MTRLSNKLSARRAETLKDPGRYSDGNGLYLRITPDSKRWTFMYMWAGKRVEIGLGAYRDTSLIKAREKAQDCRDLIASGTDPRNKPKLEEEQAKTLTFGEMADKFIGGKEGGWKNEKHRDQWRMTLSRRRDKAGNLTKDGYCRTMADILVADVSTEHVLTVLKPIWLTKPETARRVRGRVEAVLDAAKALGYRSGENPALWRGHLSNLLARPKKLSRGHHAAIPYAALPAFYRGLADEPSISDLALCFTILTAARSGETIGMVWPEVDRERSVWRVPAERMKAGREHVVPLLPAALAVLDAMEKHKKPNNPFVFPGAGTSQLSIMALAMALRRAGGGDFTVHGMRSAFRDWCGDKTSFQRDDVELCLAHQIKDETERAYRRSDAIEKRRKILEAWGNFVTKPTAQGIVDFAARRAALTK
ncbi:site-specific integrase [Mesorhizobium sp. WSM3876]|uniref:tyrosine-type recombinase/integrase n=1 Tax=Mesorhizobium sp. WSM3876 TaxID=422277 RepID=UPI000BB00059|nr:site-specific integrase [Mesorhizobium sp. WSM3876]PBB85718.1 integrase [Mesorhizobium sp. WSM3876]